MHTSPLAAHDRRAFFALGGAGVLGGRSPRPPAHPDTIEAIVEAAAGLATEIAQDERGHDEAWTFAATALLTRLREVPPDPFTAPSAREQAFLDARGWTFRRVHAARVRADGPQVITHQLWIPPVRHHPAARPPRPVRRDRLRRRRRDRAQLRHRGRRPRDA